MSEAVFVRVFFDKEPSTMSSLAIFMSKLYEALHGCCVFEDDEHWILLINSIWTSQYSVWFLLFSFTDKLWLHNTNVGRSSCDDFDLNSMWTRQGGHQLIVFKRKSHDVRFLCTPIFRLNIAIFVYLTLNWPVIG